MLYNNSKGDGSTKREDLTGKRFGSLIALEYVGNKKWLCKCECGLQKEFATSNLKLGKSSSCGCKNKSSFKNLEGERFGKLTVIKYIKYPKRNKWLCKCDCGNETEVTTDSLLSGKTKSCGCIRKGKFIDLTGKKFSYLTVISHVTFENKKRNKWLCKCDCGKMVLVESSKLRKSEVKSCGCKKKTLISQSNSKNGQSHTRLMKVWYEMKRRCTDINSKEYLNYGERGITICKEWLSDYETFKKWALENNYSEKLTIDRIDVNGNYEPSNCRWATRKEQNNNKRNTQKYTYDNKTLTLNEWSKITGISYSNLYKRLKIYNFSIDKALTKK